MNKKSIKFWNEDDRPIEKLLSKGADVLSNSELIAILLKTGTTKKSAIDIAKEIMDSCQNELPKLLDKTRSDFTQFNGIGDKKAATILAALEIGKRVRQGKVISTKINAPSVVFELMSPVLSHLKHEEFWVLYLNNALGLIEYIKISQGGLNKTIVEPKLIIKKAIDLLASSVILCHNHPSGNLDISEDDLQLTKKIKEACQVFDIRLDDHIVIARNHYTSFRDKDFL